MTGEASFAFPIVLSKQALTLPSYIMAVKLMETMNQKMEKLTMKMVKLTMKMVKLTMKIVKLTMKQMMNQKMVKLMMKQKMVKLMETMKQMMNQIKKEV